MPTIAELTEAFVPIAKKEVSEAMEGVKSHVADVLREALDGLLDGVSDAVDGALTDLIVDREADTVEASTIGEDMQYFLNETDVRDLAAAIHRNDDRVIIERLFDRVFAGDGAVRHWIETERYSNRAIAS